MQINQELINEAMTIIRGMDHDTWKQFDKLYAKERPELDVIKF